MKCTRAFRAAGALLPALVLGSSDPAAAQGAARFPVGVFISGNAGVARPAVDSFTNLAFVESGPNRDEARADYAIERSPTLDIGGGAIIGPGLLVGLAVSRYADRQPADVTLTLQHPIAHPTLVATTRSEPLERTESAVHIQFGYAAPPMGRLHLMAFGGPSRYSVRQPLVVDFDADEIFNPATRTWSAVVSDPVVETKRASAWGYHVGADVSVSVTPNVGVGTLVRYGKATVTMEDPFQSQLRDRNVTQDLDAGGLQVTGGIRLRF